ncbi:MAG: hypothetical protein KGJ58_04570 [Patescibacteria group bacterium]|nr:hypothetical protein [Patescibacteria group bacterium]MDE1988758.1 hypothetical protein [Patescibacteria group bacterium]MDE2218685.1 hypothetical protein [Patescibacteria group bacterium]
MKSDIMRWKAYEYNHREKSSDWFWAVGIIAFSAATAAIIFNNAIFAIFIILSAFTLSMYAARKPALVNIELNDKGVIVGKNIYFYQTLEKFWVARKKWGNVILLKSKKTLLPYVTIPADQVDSEQITKYLSRHIKEEEMNEPLTLTIMEYLGF